MRELITDITREVTLQEIKKSIKKVDTSSKFFDTNDDNIYQDVVSRYLTDVIDTQGFQKLKDKFFFKSLLEVYLDNNELHSSINLICLFETSVLSECEEYFFKKVNIGDELHTNGLYYFTKLLELYKGLLNNTITDINQFKMSTYIYPDFTFMHDLLDANIKKYTNNLDLALENFYVTTISIRIQIVEAFYYELNAKFRNAAIQYTAIFKLALATRQKIFLIDRISNCLGQISGDNGEFQKEIMTNIIASLIHENDVSPNSKETLGLSKVLLNNIPPSVFAFLVSNHYLGKPLFVPDEHMNNPCVISLYNYLESISK
jgi:hypothetical protein